ncbi:MAG: hypothetical protein LBL90_05210 [Prevotellaceae bacterium]|jgi:antitoxin component YwqK of YwqJK toxin-antitoxin module|nr:hypothetical protein [Prevotellaceae bacterium]
MELGKDTYANRQKIYILEGTKLTFFFKDGKLKAEGSYENDMMQGEWKFYRATGQLWVIGYFKDDKKDGSWVRYDKNDRIEYNEEFKDGKLVKNK